jgi:UDP-perosamine 4-acetyltransferase
MKGRDPVHVIGAGGHAKVVIATIRALGMSVAAVWDDDPMRVGTELAGVPVVGSTASVPDGSSAVIAVGSNLSRREIARRMQGLRFLSIVHPVAVVHESVVVGAGSVLFAGAIVQPGARLGEHVIVNTAATIDHDCELEDYVHVCPGSHLAGHVHLGEGVLMGIGSSAIPNSEVGPWAVIGAGAVVVRSVPAGVTAVGCPARVYSTVRKKA